MTITEVQHAMWHDLLVAISLVFVIEGVLPFLSPAYWRDMMETVAHFDERSIRLIGLSSMLIGIGLLYLVN